MKVYDLKNIIKQIISEIPSADKFIMLLKKHFSSTLFQNGYYLIGSTAVTSILSMVLWAVAARYYPTNAVGIGSAIISSWELLSIFSNLGLGITLIRFLPGAGPKSNSMVNTCFTVVGIASIVTAIIFLCGIKIWSPALLAVTQNPIFIAAFILCAVVWGLNTIVEIPFLARRLAKYSLIKNTIIGVLRLALIVVFLVVANNTIGIVASAGIGMAAGLLIAVFWFLPKVQRGYTAFLSIQKEIVCRLFRYSAANYIAKILMEATPTVLPLMVINLLGAEMNAYFYISWSIARVLQVIPIAIFNSLFAEASNDEKLLRINVLRSLRITLLLMVPAMLVLIGIANPLLQIFGVTYSENGALALRIMALSAIPFSVNYLYITICRVRKYLVNIMVASAVSSFLTLGLSWFLMSIMNNLTAVAIGFLFGQGAIAMVLALLIYVELRSDKNARSSFIV